VACFLVVTVMAGALFNITDVPSQGIATLSEKVITLGSVVDAAGSVDYTFDGVADDVQLQAALNALPATGGRLVIVSSVQINLTALTTVTRAISNVIIEGSGRGTYFVCDGATPIFTAGGNNWQFINFRTDAGGIANGATTGWMWTAITVNAAYYSYQSPYGQSTFNDTTVASLTDSGLTNGRIPITGVGGLLYDDSHLTYNATTGTLATDNISITSTSLVTNLNADYLDGVHADTLSAAAADTIVRQVDSNHVYVIVTKTATMLGPWTYLQGTDVIQAAIDNAPSVGGHVYLSGGTDLRLASSVVVTGKDMTISGAQMWRVILERGVLNDFPLFYLNPDENSSFFTFRYLGLKGNGAFSPTGTGILSTNRVLEINIEHVNFWGFNVAVDLATSSGGFITNNSFEAGGNSDYEVRVRGGTGAKVIGNDFKGNYTCKCISMEGNSWIVSDNYFNSNTTISIYAKGLGGQIIGNTGQVNIYLASTANATHIISNNLAQGVYNLYGDLGTSNVIVSSNNFQGSGEDMLGTNYISSNITGVSSNRIYQNTGYITENSGTGQVLNGTTVIGVAHGLSFTPTAQNIVISPTNNLGAANKLWVTDNATSQYFWVSLDVDPASDNATFSWNANRN
jgi:hypothetical protein